MKHDLVSVVEAAYQVQTPPQEWLAELIEGARPHVDEGLGVVAFYYDASDLSKLQTLAIVGVGRIGEDQAILPLIGLDAGPEIMRSIMWRAGCASASEILGRDRFLSTDAFKKHGFVRGYHDFVQVNATDTTGRGVMIGAPRERTGAVPARRAAALSRVASHISAALRLRHALTEADAAIEKAEAILDPDGTAQELKGPAQAARESLREAARAIDRARGTERNDDALRAWTALTEGRWSLIDHFERDGRRFLVAVPNPPDVRDPRALTERERHVAAFAALGESNKMIGYELGISTSRVASHLAEAQRKLGVRSRVELVQVVRSLAASPLMREPLPTSLETSRPPDREDLRA